MTHSAASPAGVTTPPETAWTSEGVDFLRRVAGGEVYTGVSGESLAEWAAGLTDQLTYRPLDRGDLARCMNVYWSAPESLRPQMRGQILRWAKRLKREAGGERQWMFDGMPDFDTPRYYRRRDDLNTYWATERPGSSDA